MQIYQGTFNNKSTLWRITTYVGKNFELKVRKRRGVSKVYGKLDLMLFRKETGTLHKMLEIKLQRSRVLLIFLLALSMLN